MIYKLLEAPGLYDDVGRSSPEQLTTANELAKDIVADIVDSAGYWSERYSDVSDAMTDREREQVDRMVDKQVYRVLKLLGRD